MASATKSVPARILNEIVDELNHEDHLPKYLIIIPDKNIIEYVNFGGFRCKKIFDKLLDWILININESINLRKEDL